MWLPAVLLTVAGLFSVTSGHLRTLDKVRLTTLSCKANCLENYTPAGMQGEFNCFRHPQCWMCWLGCKLFHQNVEAWSILCGPKSQELCLEGCKTSCRFHESDNELSDAHPTGPLETQEVVEDVKYQYDLEENNTNIEWDYRPDAQLSGVILVVGTNLSLNETTPVDPRHLYIIGRTYYRNITIKDELLDEFCTIRLASIDSEKKISLLNVHTEHLKRHTNKCHSTGVHHHPPIISSIHVTDLRKRYNLTDDATRHREHRTNDNDNTNNPLQSGAGKRPVSKPHSSRAHGIPDTQLSFFSSSSSSAVVVSELVAGASPSTNSPHSPSDAAFRDRHHNSTSRLADPATSTNTTATTTTTTSTTTRIRSEAVDLRSAPLNRVREASSRSRGPAAAVVVEGVVGRDAAANHNGTVSSERRRTLPDPDDVTPASDAALAHPAAMVSHASETSIGSSSNSVSLSRRTGNHMELFPAPILTSLSRPLSTYGRSSSAAARQQSTDQQQQHQQPQQQQQQQQHSSALGHTREAEILKAAIRWEPFMNSSDEEPCIKYKVTWKAAIATKVSGDLLTCSTNTSISVERNSVYHVWVSLFGHEQIRTQQLTVETAHAQFAKLHALDACHGCVRGDYTTGVSAALASLIVLAVAVFLLIKSYRSYTLRDHKLRDSGSSFLLPSALLGEPGAKPTMHVIEPKMLSSAAGSSRASAHVTITPIAAHGPEGQAPSSLRSNGPYEPLSLEDEDANYFVFDLPKNYTAV